MEPQHSGSNKYISQLYTRSQKRILIKKYIDIFLLSDLIGKFFYFFFALTSFQSFKDWGYDLNLLKN